MRGTDGSALRYFQEGVNYRGRRRLFMAGRWGGIGRGHLLRPAFAEVDLRLCGVRQCGKRGLGRLCVQDGKLAGPLADARRDRLLGSGGTAGSEALRRRLDGVGRF